MKYIIEWRCSEARQWKVWDIERSYETRELANERLRLVRGIYPDTRFRIRSL